MSPQAKRNACGINYAIAASVSTPAAIAATAVVAAATVAAASADTDSDANADRRSSRLVHHGRRRTANHHDFILGVGARRGGLRSTRLGGSGSTRLIGTLTFSICGGGCTLQGQVGAASATFCGTRGVGGGDGRGEVGTVAQPLFQLARGRGQIAVGDISPETRDSPPKY